MTGSSLSSLGPAIDGSQNSFINVSSPASNTSQV
jgi:hypothetical protein